MRRTDIYNIAADVALETAIASVMATETGGIAGEFAKPAATNRKEAMRFLVRRLMLKERNNATRVIVANSKIGEAVT